jgi:hypothetical protein
METSFGSGADTPLTGSGLTVGFSIPEIGCGAVVCSDMFVVVCNGNREVSKEVSK